MYSKIESNQRRFHIIIDGWGCNQELISDKQLVEETMRQIARICGMNIVHGPVTVAGTAQNPGLTGFAIIDFSHISIHTFANEREVCVDIFSCKQFNYEAVKNYIKRAFGLQDSNIKYAEVKY